MTEFAQGAILIAPLFVGLLAHGLCIRFGMLRALAVPIEREWFGQSKTYRGIVCVASGTAVGFALLDPKLLPFVDAGPARRVLAGAVVGGAAMLAELPNSFLKRRAGIPPGEQASGIRGLVFHVLDQVDLVFGAWAALAWLVRVTPSRFLGSLITMYVGHQVVSLVGYQLGMRKTAR